MAPVICPKCMAKHDSKKCPYCDGKGDDAVAGGKGKAKGK